MGLWQLRVNQGRVSPEPGSAVSVKRNVIANYLGQGWAALMGLAFLPVYIKHLGIESYGLIGLFTVLQAWLTLLDMGMTPTLNREMARFSAGAHSSQSIRDLLRSLEMVCLGLAALIGLGVWATSGWLAHDWLHADRLPSAVVAHALSVVALVIALRFVEGVYRGALFGLQRQVWYNVVNAGLATLRWAGAVGVLVWVSPTVEAFFVWQAACSLLTVLVFAAKVHGALPASPSPPKFSPTAVAGIWQFAVGMMGTTLLVLLLTQVDKIILSRLLTLESFGYYTLATAVAAALYMLISPITAAVYPRMVELATVGDEANLASIYHHAAQIVVALTAPAALMLLFFSRGVLFVWSGNASLAENAGPVLSALALGTFFNGLMHIPYQLQLAHGWTSLAVKSNMVAVVLLVPAILWLAPTYGAVGAAWIWVVLNAGYVLIGIQFMHRRLIANEKWRWYAEDVLMPSAAALLVLLLASSLEPSGYHERSGWFVFLLISGTSSLIAAVLLAARLRSPLIDAIQRRWSRAHAT
jgi:O-antigen/teichoic acid export membrane protein